MEKEQHICEEDKTCKCYQLADEPADDCPIHGSPAWPPRCGICGRFICHPKPSGKP
jgi:hypothetical protein